MNIESVLAKIQSLPPMPAIALKLLEAAQDVNIDLGKVAGWIEKDASMTFKCGYTPNASEKNNSSVLEYPLKKYRS